MAILSKQAEVEPCHGRKRCGGRGEGEKPGEMYQQVRQSTVRSSYKGCTKMHVVKTKECLKESDGIFRPLAKWFARSTSLFIPGMSGQ